MCRYSLNPYRETAPQWSDPLRAAFEGDDILDLHRSLDEYRATPLVSLPALADELGVGQVLVKDEAHRFGLKAFKGLGASYAVYRFVVGELTSRGDPVPPARDFYRQPGVVEAGRYTFCTATDGNHGRAVAFTARKLRQRAVIFVPGNTVPARIKAIESEGARVVTVDGSYDDAVAEAAAIAQKSGWQIISDTSWPGYEDIPRWIMAGYLTMFREIHEASLDTPRVDIVVIQAGVGAFAGAAAWYYNMLHSVSGVKLMAVEPTHADCLLQSISSAGGNPVTVAAEQDSIMAGLNCGTPSVVAWPLVKHGFDLFLSVSDDYCVRAMRRLYYPEGDDVRLVSGESGAAGLAALLALRAEPSLSPAVAFLDLSPDSSVLLINTEGDTGAAGFGALVDASGHERG